MVPLRVLRRRSRGEPGFALPLASLISLLLLVSSLSVHAVSLQGRLRGETELRLQTEEDRLASAAQLLVARIQLRHPCLLSLALEQWSSAACVDASDLAPLLQGEALGAHWQLRRWQPLAPADSRSPQPLTFEIALAPSGNGSPLRAGFDLRLSGPPWRVLELRPLGLRGELP